MSVNLEINTAPDDGQELQRLLAQQAEIQAEIAALLPSSTAPPSSNQFHQSPIHKQQQRRRSSAPRSISSNGTNMSRHLSQDQITRPSQTQRSFSQFSAFPPVNAGSRQENPAMMPLATQELPLGSYGFSPLHKTILQRSPELTEVFEDLEDPRSFLSRTIGIPTVAGMPSISIPSPTTLDNHRLSRSSFNVQTPSASTSDSLISVNSVSSSKSNNSSYGSSMGSSTSRSRSGRGINSNRYHVRAVRKSTPAQAMRKSSVTVSEGKYQTNEALPSLNPEIPFSCQSSQFMTYPDTYEWVGTLKEEYTSVTGDRNFCFLPLSPKPKNKPENYSSLPRQDTNEKQVVSSPTLTYPLEKSVSRETLSSYSDDETEWDENELSPDLLNLNSFQEALVERIMDQFWKIFNQENNVTSLVRNNTVYYDNYCQTTSPTDEGDNKSSRDTTVSPTETQAPSQRTPARNERKRSRDSQDNQDDNDDERSSKRRRTLCSPPLKEDDDTKFACPYRKHNPRKYCVRDWRPCALTPLDTVARVKAHLYRHHRIFPCQRCKELFEDQDQVSEHLKKARACELRDTLQADGVTSEIVEKLRSRKRAHKDQTEVEKWQDIYKLLFPNEIVPSPYFDPVQDDTSESPDFRALDGCEEYCRRELPKYVRAAIEEAVHQGQRIENVIGSHLMDIIRHCQSQVYSRYRSSAAPATSPALRNPVESTSPTARSPPIRNIIDNSAEFINPLKTNLEPPAPTYFERPLPQTHLESRLESSTSEHTTFNPVGQTSSPDSGYISNDSTTPVAPSEGLSHTVPELPESNPHSNHSYSTIEKPSLEQELSQDELGFHGTGPSAQEPYDPFGGEWNMSNTEGGSWFGDFDPAVPGGTDWTLCTDADLGFPQLYY